MTKKLSHGRHFRIEYSAVKKTVFPVEQYRSSATRIPPFRIMIPLVLLVRVNRCQTKVLVPPKTNENCPLSVLSRGPGLDWAESCTAENFYNTLKRLIKILPPGTIKSLTGDRGKEFAWYQKIENELRIPFYFADPHSPWQKGSNENTNGLLRENFPKKTNFSTVTQRDLYWKGVYRINNRPRKVLGWKTAQECFAEELRNSA